MELALRHGLCLIDDDQWHGRACMWTWRSTLGSVRHTAGRPNASAYVIGHPLSDYYGTDLELHRFVLDLPPYRDRRIDVDHINGNGLDCRRENLRIATRPQNLANSGSRRGSTSQFKGVSFDRRNGKWKAQIMIEGRNYNLGRFGTEEDAARTYNAAARQAWGEFARLNDVHPRFTWGDDWPDA